MCLVAYWMVCNTDSESQNAVVNLPFYLSSAQKSLLSKNSFATSAK